MTVPLTKVIVVASPRITAATSSGSAIRLSGLLAIRWARCCGGPHLGHRRLHQAGRDGDDPDRRRQGPRQGHRHRVKPGLGRGIGDVAAAAAHPRHRADIDDEAMPARLEQRPAGAHRGKGAAQIDRQHEVEERVVERAQIGMRDHPGAAGIVDEDVEPALGRARSRRRGFRWRAYPAPAYGWPGGRCRAGSRSAGRPPRRHCRR